MAYFGKMHDMLETPQMGELNVTQLTNNAVICVHSKGLFSPQRTCIFLCAKGGCF